MTRKKTIISMTLVALTVAGSLLIIKRPSSLANSSKTIHEIKKVIASNLPLGGSLPNPSVAMSKGSKALNPWDSFSPLNEDEKTEFESVEAQVQKFLTWGKMDPEAVPAFRQTLFKMGDRAIAELARGLSQLTSEDIKDKAAAEDVVRQIDQLAYFASTENPLAHDSIKALALRPVSWTSEGQLVNAVEANITFEAFDIYSRYHQGEALAHIQTIDKKYRTAYFTRYAYGRKLAGKTMDDIDLELKNVFGSPELALK